MLNKISRILAVIVLFRLWESAHTVLWWTIFVLLVLEWWTAETVKTAVRDTGESLEIASISQRFS